MREFTKQELHTLAAVFHTPDYSAIAEWYNTQVLRAQASLDDLLEERSSKLKALRTL